MLYLSLMTQGAISISQAWDLPIYMRKRYIKLAQDWWRDMQKMYSKANSYRCPFMGK